VKKLRSTGFPDGKNNAVNSRKSEGRHLKNRVHELLKSPDLDRALDELCRFPARQVISPLFSFLYNGDEHLRWQAITAMGKIVAGLANEDMEAARVIMRRLMWNLNDESGGIGWGSPEAMGEILAQHKDLAEEYAHVLISYAREDGNYLEHEMLQRGLLWGIARLSQVRPSLVQEAVPHLVPFLTATDPALRGMAACIMGLLGAKEARSELEVLTGDDAEFDIFCNQKRIRRSVKEAAKEALEKFQVQKNRNGF